MNLGPGGKATWVFYDSFLGDGSTQNFTLFTTPIGSGGKTKYQTNMRLAGQLSQSTSFKVMALACGCLPDTPLATLKTFMDGYFEFYIGGEIWYEAPIFTVPAGYGWPVQWDSASAGTANVAPNGTPLASNLLSLDRALDIGANEEMRVDFVTQAATTEAVKFWFFLYGEYTKPLQ